MRAHRQARDVGTSLCFLVGTSATIIRVSQKCCSSLCFPVGTFKGVSFVDKSLVKKARRKFGANRANDNN